MGSNITDVIFHLKKKFKDQKGPPLDQPLNSVLLMECIEFVLCSQFISYTKVLCGYWTQSRDIVRGHQSLMYMEDISTDNAKVFTK